MWRSDGSFRTLPTVVIALLANIALDVAFDLPMLVRWGVAVAVGLVPVLVLTAVRRRGAVRRGSAPDGAG